MKRFATSAAALLTAASFSQASDLNERDLCANGATDAGGNWYCQLVNAVTYTGIGHSGSYNQITNMGADGVCSSTTKSYSGNLAPFDEEVSLHFRGPLTLKQLAVYTPSGTQKRDEPAARHGHAAAHAKRAVGDLVHATINGVLVSWINEYTGEPTPAPVAVNNHLVGNPYADGAAQPAAHLPVTTAAPVAQQAPAAAGSYGSSTSNSGWARQGYYNAANGTSSGLTFLNHFGGTGSGVFDYNFGNSLSYASADGLSGSGSSQTLADTTLPSTAEVIVFTDKKCSGSDCGYTRPGSVAYHGFDGAEKVFLLEFGMPVTGEQAANIYSPKDMPAIWMLNAQIPRTLQYGTASCSCWTSGCGEFDIFEVLAPGDTRCKSTIHGNARGGDSDYFPRPVSGTQKAAVVMSNNQFHIKLLDASQTFDPSLDSSFISSLISSTNTQTDKVSLFALGQ